MLQIGDKKINKLYVGSKAVSILYVGAKRIWSAVNSCFGSGVWVGKKTWSNTDSWK